MLALLRYGLILAVLGAGGGGVYGQPRPPSQAVSQQALRQAAKHFERGQLLYNEGKYSEAIDAFTEAQRIAPHRSALFNIARCHENLGNRAKALEFYRSSLPLTQDPDKRADVEFRIRRIETRPVKVFVSSKPSGASVTVDGNALPEAQRTPTVLALVPGEHLLLLRLDGHHLAAQRVRVQTDKELPLEVELKPLPEPCPPPSPPCRVRACPKNELVDLRNLHLHASLMGSIGYTTDRNVGAGPGVQVHGILRQVVFGAHFLAFPMGEESLGSDPSPTATAAFTRATFRWLIGQVEGGYAIPFPNWYAHATVGLGLSADRVTFGGQQLVAGTPSGPELRMVAEQLAFAWSIGGGVNAMLLRWISVGASGRFGMIHGDRAAKELGFSEASHDNFVQIDERKHFVYTTFWGSITFHL